MPCSAKYASTSSTMNIIATITARRHLCFLAIFEVCFFALDMATITYILRPQGTTNIEMPWVFLFVQWLQNSRFWVVKQVLLGVFCLEYQNKKCTMRATNTGISTRRARFGQRILRLKSPKLPTFSGCSLIFSPKRLKVCSFYSRLI